MANKEVAFKIVVDTSEVGEGVEKSVKSVEELGTATAKTSKEMQTGFKAAEQGTKGLGSSIGGLIKSLGLIGVAMAVFEFMKDIISKNQKIMDLLSTATTALEIIINKLFKALEPVADVMKKAFENPKQAVLDLWEVIKENFINRLEGVILAVQAAGKAIEAAFNFDWDAAKDAALDFGSALIQVGTGLDAAQQKAFVEGVKDFIAEVSQATKDAVSMAAALVALRKEVELAEIAQRKLQLVYQTEAENQRQIRDDISLTIAERLKANEKLGEILEDQLKNETALAQKKLDLANLEIAANGERLELLKQRGEAELALQEVLERVGSQESEQKTNQKALEKELFDFQQELRSALLVGREKELEDTQIYYDNLNEIARKAGEDNFEIEAARATAINELHEKFRKEDLIKEAAAEKAKLDLAKKVADSKINAANSVAGALGAISNAVAEQGKAGLIASKVLAVAQIAIDTATAISGAISSASKASNVYEMIAGIAAGIAAVTSGIASATAILNSANVAGPSASTPSVSSISSSAPSFNPVTTNTTELGNTQAAELAPIQAFVVETAITGSQNNVGQIEGQATFGNPG
tara:strand:+ start:1126 stop:2877 length:1752 start_codon:yes stop_codon:yes gene_type:complete